MGLFSRKPKPEVKYSAPDDRGWSRIFDWHPGAWQQDAQYDSDQSVLAFYAMFACFTLISDDIGKLGQSVERLNNGIWEETDEAADILSRPNPYQNHIQFKQWWVLSKLIHGNTYALKVRGRGGIEGLYLLDPTKVTPLVADNGDVFYRLQEDNLSGLTEAQMVVPASEIIHDRYNCLYHPLVGLPPTYASAQPAGMGMSIQKNAGKFFKNSSNPGGILTAPGEISEETAVRLKEYWTENFTGDNSGKVAALGDGLKFEPMRMSNIDAQMMESLKWTAEVACSVTHVPAYMVGVGAMPTHNNIEALTQQYYAQCLQIHVESYELALGQGIGIPRGTRVQLDIDGLFRTDTATKMEMLGKGINDGLLAPDEGRKRVNLKAVPGGQYPYLQQQNYSLEALAQRDATNPLAAPQAPAPISTEEDETKALMVLDALISKSVQKEA